MKPGAASLHTERSSVETCGRCQVPWCLDISQLALGLDYITSKANSTLGFLRRNINISNPQIREHSYKTLVRPIVEYSQSVWDPCTTGRVSPGRAARYTLSRTTTTNLFPVDKYNQ